MDAPTNVTKLPLKQARLRCDTGWCAYTFSFDEKYVTVEFRHAFGSGARKHDLWRLIPAPVTEQERNQEGAKQFRRGLGFLLATIVVFFSDLPRSIPLLAPALLLVGLVEVCIGYFQMKPRVFTKFFGSGEGALISIPNEGILEGDREAFIEGLSSAVHDARVRVYGTAAV